MKEGLSKLGLAELPQDCVVLCGGNISPVKVGQHLTSAGLGQVQVYHGGVDTFDRLGEPDEYLGSCDSEEQEKVGRSWLDGEGGALVTHLTTFNGCEAGTAVYISEDSTEAGVRSGMLRGVAGLVLVGAKEVYKKEKMEGTFDVIDIEYDDDDNDDNDNDTDDNDDDNNDIDDNDSHICCKPCSIM